MADTLSVRIDDARQLLRLIPDRYRYALGLIYAEPGQQLGAGRRTGKPVSTMPRGADHQLRAALVDCCRAVADGHQACDRLGWPQPVWTPSTLGSAVRSVHCFVDRRGKGRQVVEVVVCRLVWRWQPDADDLSVEPLGDVGGVCSQLDGMLARLGQGRLSKVERDVAYETVGCVKRAVDCLDNVGVWEPPADALQERCTVCGWRLPEADRRKCQPCRKGKAAA